MSNENLIAVQAADYARPERQADLAQLRERVEELLIGHNVLHLGNEYWTSAIEGIADSVGEGAYTAVFANWSDIKREDQERFLKDLKQQVGKDVLLVLVGEAYVEGSSTVTARTDLAGNTYQIRSNAAGERFEMLKNYPTDSYLRKKLASFSREIRIERHKYYWLVNCRLK
jgi:hypothetical protein